jgi:type II secretory pathway component PulJ
MTLREKKSGYSLVEMLIYVALVFLISTVVVQMLVNFSQTYRTLITLRNIEHAAIDSIERMTRDIRGATTVIEGSSVFGTNPGVLTLVKTVNSVSTTTRYYVDNGVMKLDVNNVYFGPLTSSNTSVTNIVYRLLNNGTSKAIKIDMTIQGGTGPAMKTKTYHSTIVLGGL